MSEGVSRAKLGLRCGTMLVAGLAAIAVVKPAPARENSVAAAAAPASPRQMTDLRDGWRFRFGAVPDAAILPEFDDREWQPVSLPHTWNRMGNDGLARAQGSDVNQGTGWYRLRLPDLPLASGRRAVLQFDGVGAIADVWVNGTRVGTHKGAFSRFRFDITGHLKSGQTNLITVRTDNSKPGPGSTTEHVIPLGGDFFIHGGLYRGVSLILADEASIDLMDHGGPGIYVSTPRITAQQADVTVLSRLRNAGNRPRQLTLITRIADAKGRNVASGAQPLRLAPGATSEVTTALALPNPRLWQGRSEDRKSVV